MAFNDDDWLTTTLDCQDNSCIYRDRTKPSGMRTNGGCRCMSDLRPQTKRLFVNKMFWELKRRQEAIAYLLTLLPGWDKEIPKDLDPTFYMTTTYEGDVEVKEKVDELKKKYLED